MIYDASRNRLAADGLSRLYYVERQGLAMVLGLIAMAGRDRDRLPANTRRSGCSPTSRSSRYLPQCLVLGRNHKGAQAWFQVGPLQFQPSEIAKIAVVDRDLGLLPSTSRRPRRVAARSRRSGWRRVVMAHRLRPARPRDDARHHGVRGRGARGGRPQAGAHRRAPDARGHPRGRGRREREGPGVSTRPAHRVRRPVDQGRDEPRSSRRRATT